MNECTNQTTINLFDDKLKTNKCSREVLVILFYGIYIVGVQTIRHQLYCKMVLLIEK